MEIIAEIGQNHNGDMDLAVRLIRAARRGGADAAKFQVYDAKALFPKQDNPWYDYNCRTELSQEQVRRLAAACEQEGIEFLASVFDVDRVAWLEDVGVRRFKLASRSIRDIALIERLCRTGRPLLVSLGMWTGRDFPVIPTRARVDYLYCISEYPTSLDRLRLASVDFTRYAGFSDHTTGIHAAQAALARGARILEKHFTLDKNMVGPDHAGSMNPSDLERLHAFRLDLQRMM